MTVPKGLMRTMGLLRMIFTFPLSPLDEEMLISPNTPDVSLEHPHISGNYVVCEGLDLLNGTYDIYLCNLGGRFRASSMASTSPLTPLTRTRKIQIFPGSMWCGTGLTELTNKHDVFLYHIPSRSNHPSSNDTPESDQQNPSIHVDKVVWEDTRLNT